MMCTYVFCYEYHCFQGYLLFSVCVVSHYVYAIFIMRRIRA